MKSVNYSIPLNHPSNGKACIHMIEHYVSLQEGFSPFSDFIALNIASVNWAEPV